ncbi:MAG TPA: type 3 dihydrofolate reductase [Gammaproteobacteria bacterium]|nr:type 3 dihydrofolate reductase [Gammaproteobacteria bacterium]
MVISLVVAMARNRVMGRDNALPWHLPADLKYFKRITMGKPIVMGRKTFESIGRMLPGRANIVITHDHGYRADGCLVVHSIDEALAAAAGAPEVMIIGGAKLFEQTLPRATRIYLTEINADITGDTYFPKLDDHIWGETQRVDCAPDEQNPYSYSFRVLDKCTGRQLQV